MKRVGKWVAGVLAVLAAALVLLYFSLQRPDIPFATLETRYASSASRFVELPRGTRVHYRDQGRREAPTLLLIHGFGASLETWESWVKVLADRYRLISLDLPGHGLTRSLAQAEHVCGIRENVELLASFVKQLRIERAIVVGNSMGGTVAWNLAIAHPELVQGLVLVDASGWEWSRQQQGSNWIFSMLGSRALRNLDKTWLIRQSLLSAYFDKSRVTDAVVRRYVDFARAPGHRELLDRTIVRTMSGVDDSVKATKAKLAKIQAPTLIVWGARDEVVAVGDATRFAQAITGSEVRVYSNVGHVPMEEAAAESAKDVDAWIARALRSP